MKTDKMEKGYKRYKVFYNILKILCSVVLYFKLISQPIVFTQANRYYLLPVGCVFYVGISITDFSY